MTLPVAVVVTLLVVMAVEIQRSSAAPGPKGTTTACANAGESAADLGAKQLRKAVRCLVNEQRLARGLGKLSRDASLERAARRHSRVMVNTDCLAHRCEDELSLERRLAKAGYFDGTLAWEYAENTGCAPTAEAMVKSWMASREHRIYMLDRDFRELGVGSTPAPVLSLCEEGYTTFALVVAWRELTP